MSLLWELISILLKLALDILLFLSPIIIIAVIVCEIKEKKRQKKEAKKKQTKAEEDRRIREFENQSQKVYAENLPRLYDHRSTSELKRIYDLLKTMHHNDWDFNDWSSGSAATDRAFFNAQDELLKAMGNPSWKRLLRNGKIEYSSTPIYVAVDLNYVYSLLNSRGVTNW